jgi:uncharacterized protein (TIGR00369 family)
MDYDAENHMLRRLGMYDVDIPEGADLAMALPVHPGVTNPRGGLQGGLLATLVDVVAGRSALARAGEGKTVPTSDLHLRFLSPVTEGPAVGVARVVRSGRFLIVVNVEVHDAGRDVLAATATLAFSVLEARPEQRERERIYS